MTPRASSARLAQLVAALERRLDAADDPLHVRLRDGRPQVGTWVRGHMVWRDVQFLSTYVLSQGYGLLPEDDIPF